MTNSVTPGALNLTTPLGKIGVEMVVTDDDNNNATCQVQYKKSSDVTWSEASHINGQELFPCLYWYSSAPKAFYTSIYYVDPGVSYDVRCIISDTDGGGATVTGTVVTRAEDIPLASSFTPTHYVDPVNGLDSNTGTSLGAAWKTWAKAMSAPSGAVVEIEDGSLHFFTNVAARTTPLTIIGKHLPVAVSTDTASGRTRHRVQPANIGAHTVIEPYVIGPTGAVDTDLDGIASWTQVTLDAPKFQGATSSTNTAWKLTVPFGAPIQLGWADTRWAERKAVFNWRATYSDTVQAFATPHGAIEYLRNNQSYTWGWYTPPSAVQKVNVTAGSSGTFTLTYSGLTTTDLAYGASAATVQSALRALVDNSGPTAKFPLNLQGGVEVTKIGSYYLVTMRGVANPSLLFVAASSTLTITVAMEVFSNEIYMVADDSFDPNAYYWNITPTGLFAFTNNGSNIRLYNLEIRGFDVGIYYKSGSFFSVQDHCWVHGCTMNNRSDGTGSADHVIQYCRNGHTSLYAEDSNTPGFSHMPWATIKLDTKAADGTYNGTQFHLGVNNEVYGLSGINLARRIVVRYCECEGSMDAYGFGNQNTSRYSSQDFFLHDCFIHHCIDDLSQIAFYGHNSSSLDNIVERTLTLQASPSYGGPFDFIRNLCIRQGNFGVANPLSGDVKNQGRVTGVGWKYSGASSTPPALMRIVNNTIYSNEANFNGWALFAQGGANSENFYVRNNIVICDGYIAVFPSGKFNSDYNYYATYDNSRGMKNQNTGQLWVDDLTGYRLATGQDIHSNPGVAGFHTLPSFVDLAGDDFRLPANSQLADAALVIPMISETFSGAGPSMGALEVASSLPVTPFSYGGVSGATAIAPGVYTLDTTAQPVSQVLVGAVVVGSNIITTTGGFILSVYAPSVQAVLNSLSSNSTVLSGTALIPGVLVENIVSPALAIFIKETGTSSLITSITRNGLNFTKQTTQSNGAAGTVTLWTLLSPTVGTFDVIINQSQTQALSFSYFTLYGAASFNIGSHTSSGLTPSVALTIPTNNKGGMILDFLSLPYSASGVSRPGQTRIYGPLGRDITLGNYYSSLMDARIYSSAISYTVSTNEGNTHVYVAAAVVPA